MDINPMSLVRIVDDDEEMRLSLEFLLQTEGWNTAVYASAEEFIQKDNPLVPGCLVLDIRMPKMSGLQLQEYLSNTPYKLPIIFITAHGEIDIAVNVLKAGAFDFMTKPLDMTKFMKSISEAVAKDWEERARTQVHTSSIRAVKQLTKRELEVAELVAKGDMNKIIADKLNISEKTVHVHRGAVYKKLGVRTAVGVSKVLEEGRAERN